MAVALAGFYGRLMHDCRWQAAHEPHRCLIRRDRTVGFHDAMMRCGLRDHSIIRCLPYQDRTCPPISLLIPTAAGMGY